MKSLLKKVLEKLGYSLINNSSIRNAYIDQKVLFENKETILIFDVGAHHGETLMKYKNMLPNSKLYCFEPSSDSFQELNITKLKYSDVVIENCGFSDKSGVQTLYKNNSSATNSLLIASKTNSYIDDFTDNKGIESVKIETIDDYIRERQIDTIDILKLDIQGGELLALKGAETLLSKRKVGLIYCEVEFIEIYQKQPLFHDITNFLKQYQYKLYNIYNINYAENGQIAWADAIYLPSPL